MLFDFFRADVKRFRDEGILNTESNVQFGAGGAGAFSDGKYNITNDFGGTLYEYIGKKQALDLMHYVDQINMRYGGEGCKLYTTAGTRFKTLCIQNDLHLLDASVRHLGTDINYVVLENLYNDLKEKMDFFFDTVMLMYFPLQAS